MPFTHFRVEQGPSHRLLDDGRGRRGVVAIPGIGAACALVVAGHRCHRDPPQRQAGGESRSARGETLRKPADNGGVRAVGKLFAEFAPLIPDGVDGEFDDRKIAVGQRRVEHAREIVDLVEHGVDCFARIWLLAMPDRLEVGDEVMLLLVGETECKCLIEMADDLFIGVIAAIVELVA